MGHKGRRERSRANRSGAHKPHAYVHSRSSVKVIFRDREYFGEYEVAGRIRQFFWKAIYRKESTIQGSNPDLLARLFLIDLVSGV